MNTQFTIRSINGVAYNQRVDGSIVAHVSTTNAAILKEELIRLVESITAWQITCVEIEKRTALLQQQLPPSPQQQFDQQLEELRRATEKTERLKAPLIIPDDPVARAHTIVGGGIDMSSDDLGPPPESL